MFRLHILFIISLNRLLSHILNQCIKLSTSIFFMKLAVEESKPLLVNDITTKHSIKALSNGMIIWLVMKPITYEIIYNLFLLRL